MIHAGGAAQLALLGGDPGVGVPGRLRPVSHRRPAQGRPRRRGDPGPRAEAPLPPLTGPQMPAGSLSRRRSDGRSPSCADLLLAGAAGLRRRRSLIAGSPRGAVAWLQGSRRRRLRCCSPRVSWSSPPPCLTWLIGFRVLGLTPPTCATPLGRRGRGLPAGAVLAGVRRRRRSRSRSRRWSAAPSGRATGHAADLAPGRSATTLGPGAGRARRGVDVPRRAAGPARQRSGPRHRGGRCWRSPSRWPTSCNPNVTPLGLGNIALAGIFLGLAFYAPGGIWTAWGAHLGWNALLAALDAPVSGLPFDIPFSTTRPAIRPGSPAGLRPGGRPRGHGRAHHRRPRRQRGGPERIAT